MSEIADGVWGLRLLMVNVYLIREGGRWLLVDAGLPFTRRFIKRWRLVKFLSFVSAIGF